MAKTIVSIGFGIPAHEELCKEYQSMESVLDADIILFESNIGHYELDYREPRYQGKRMYSKNDSFNLTEHTAHWRKEISTALEYGKTVFVFFTNFQDFFIYTGRKEYSGTGRSRSTTHIVDSYDNYRFLPIELPPIIPKKGKVIKPISNPIFSSFWNDFQKYLSYESYIDGEISQPLFVTKTGQKPIGGLFRVGKGFLVLLPPLRYDEDVEGFSEYDEKKDEGYWTEKGIQFGKHFIEIIVEIDKALRNEVESTPPPQWVSEENYELSGEKKLKGEIEKKSKKIDKIVLAKNKLLVELEKESSLKRLLFEKGKPLENVIIDALEILGFQAVNYNNGHLEIDEVIVSPEGYRFIGEAEGKDNSAVNIDKFRQLSSNIQEDLQRNSVEKPSIGILFGNGFRLTEPDKRPEQFTNKCITANKTFNHILIRTTDVFRIVKYLKKSGDKAFAKKCRTAIKKSQGKIVTFPKLPSQSK